MDSSLGTVSFESGSKSHGLERFKWKHSGVAVVRAIMLVISSVAMPFVLLRRAAPRSHQAMSCHCGEGIPNLPLHELKRAGCDNEEED